MASVFLTAEWRNLVMLNWSVDPALLQPFVPAGTVLDSFQGSTYASLVGFEFNRTRLRGIRIPFHQSFEEVNLRFYVRREGKRGVVFVRELVPKFAVAAIARGCYGEKYSCVPMSRRVDSESGIFEYTFSDCEMRVQAEANSFLPDEGSLTQFITEHYWGYAAQRDGGCVEYEVKHPRWLVRDVVKSEVTGDLSRFYGVELANALNRPPDSAFVADGSDVTVMSGQRIV